MSFSFTETITLEMPDVKEGLTAFEESEFSKEHGLVIEIAAIHEGLTANYNMYSAAELKKATGSWVSPYPRPIIRDHDKNSDPLGRVMASTMAQEADGTQFIKLQAAVTDPIAMSRVSDMRYLTGSVGGRAGEALCSICSADWAKESVKAPCKHLRGSVYNGKLAYLEMKDIEFKEYSFVNMPADKNSSISVKNNNKTDADEWAHTAKIYSLDMGKESIVDLTNFQEDINILDKMKKKESVPLYLSLKGAFLSTLSYNVEEFENDTTIGVQKATSLHDDPEESESMIEENKTMEDEDILSVTEALSDDLATTTETSDEVEESDEVTEDATTEDETVSEETETPDEVEESAEEVSDDAEEQEELTEPETAEEATTDEPIETDELTESPEEDEKDIRISSLTEENARLKSALHKMLAERVVDTKIAVGIHSFEERAEIIEDHVKRSASSLADTLRDLASMKPVAPANVVTSPKIAMESKSQTVDTNDSVVTEGEEVDVKPHISAEDLFTDVLMGRTRF